ncbi:MAG: hypothetical protein VX677_00695, partial [Candidatus Poribacteria bacterium]|nr:hypothetical protein [Candidatus Poribacteria bacterium]
FCIGINLFAFPDSLSLAFLFDGTIRNLIVFPVAFFALCVQSGSSRLFFPFLCFLSKDKTVF